jgi:hypothetical protein
MNPREKDQLDDQEWRRLCSLVLAESDPLRVSELVDQLLKALDAAKDAGLKRERPLDG